MKNPSNRASHQYPWNSVKPILRLKDTKAPSIPKTFFVTLPYSWDQGFSKALMMYVGNKTHQKNVEPCNFRWKKQEYLKTLPIIDKNWHHIESSYSLTKIILEMKFWAVTNNLFYIDWNFVIKFALTFVTDSRSGTVGLRGGPALSSWWTKRLS